MTLSIYINPSDYILSSYVQYFISTTFITIRGFILCCLKEGCWSRGYQCGHLYTARQIIPNLLNCRLIFQRTNWIWYPNFSTTPCNSEKKSSTLASDSPFCSAWLSTLVGSRDICRMRVMNLLKYRFLLYEKYLTCCPTIIYALTGTLDFSLRQHFYFCLTTVSLNTQANL